MLKKSQIHKAIIVSLLLAISALTLSAPAQPLIRKDIKIPMRDGTELSANLALPAKTGRFPAILLRTPYGKGNGEDDFGQFWTENGYAFIIQDCRGTGNSKGDWYPFVNEKKDGIDTQKWVAAQPWSNGKIATAGGSYLGYTQWITVPDAPQNLKAMFTQVPPFGMYEDNAYINGAFRLQLLFGWGSDMLQPTKGEGAGLPDDWNLEEALRYLPLSTWDETTGRKVPFMRDWVAHPTCDEYWKQPGIINQLSKVKTPTITITGWYDIFIRQVLTNIPKIIKNAQSPIARKNTHLIIGPWAHGANEPAGNRDFGQNPQIDIGNLQTKWFDYWLKGKNSDINNLPPYRIFVMGQNTWKDLEHWPLKQTRPTRFYLHSSGSANSLDGNGTLSRQKPNEQPSDIFIYDPENPVPTLGGNNLLAQAGPIDQTKIEKRDDVLVYTSEKLKQKLNVIGHVNAVIYAASSATDTDWTAKLIDVYPDGSAFNLCDGIVRARYAKTPENPQLIQPGKISRYQISVGPTANTFLPGHRIRLEISSSNFPRFDRNPNTGHKFGADAQLKKATQAVYHDKSHPSHILLPVIPE